MIHDNINVVIQEQKKTDPVNEIPKKRMSIIVVEWEPEKKKFSLFSIFLPHFVCLNVPNGPHPEEYLV